MIILNKVLWATASVFLVSCGIYFTKKLKLIQFRFKKMFNGFKHKEENNITPFQTLMMSSAARIGVGSLAGVALAIHIGGIGTIFWLWISAIITAPNAFAESCLGVIFREKDKDVYKGGPAYYIDKGLGKKGLGKFYALLVIITYIFGFLTIQANTITKSLEGTLPLSPVIIGILIAFLSALVILRGVKGIADVCSKLVPIIGIFYLGLSLYILATNISVVPNILLNICKEAFNFKALGTGIIFAMIIGIQRGIFSNEAGIGTGAIASATSDHNDPVGQGMIQILGIYFTSLVICTATALIILTSDYQAMNMEAINGIEITQHALNYHLGSFGTIALIITIFLFAFSTIITGYYYGESNLKYLFPKMDNKKTFYLKILTLALLVFGSIANSTFLWSLVDILVAIMAIINIYTLYSLRDVIVNKYFTKKKPM